MRAENGASAAVQDQGKSSDEARVDYKLLREANGEIRRHTTALDKAILKREKALGRA